MLSLLNQTNKSVSSFQNNELMNINFQGTPLEKDILVLKQDFISIVFSNQTQIELIKYNHDSSTKDLNSLNSYFRANLNNLNEEKLQKKAEDTTKRIHARAEKIKKFNDMVSKENEEIINKIAKLTDSQINERNDTIKMQKDVKNLNEKKEDLKKELNKSLGFFKSIFSLFKDYKAGSRDQLKDVEEKLKKMHDYMSDSEMVLFIEKTKQLENLLLNTSAIFLNHKKYIKIVEEISDELLMIDFSNDPDITYSIENALEHLGKYLEHQKQ